MNSELVKHEAECALRYEAMERRFSAVERRMWRVEALIIGTGGTTILLLITTLLRVI